MRAYGLVACCLLSNVAHADDGEVPPLSARRIVAEVLVGTISAAVGVIPGTIGAYAIGCCQRPDDELGLGPLIYGGYAGWTLTAPLGVYWVGTRDNETGSLGAAYLGSVVGALGGVLAAWGAERSSSEGLEIAALGVALGAPIAGSIIGFNLTREYDAGARTTAVVVPVVSVHGERTLLGVAARW